MPGATKIIWVLGSGTDVGKTTIAAALVRALNRRGTPTVGFKPNAAGLLKDLIDFMLERFPNKKCALYGADGLELSLASPLTGGEMVDTVTPAQFLCHPRVDSVILARTGSVATGDVEYFRSGYTVSIQNRPDIVELTRATGLPFADAKIVEPLRYTLAPTLAPEKHQRAFAHLVTLGAKAVVCEGGGRVLPQWRGCPNPDHIVVVAGGTVFFFPNVAVGFDFKCGPELKPGTELFQLLASTRAKYFSRPLYVVERGRRREIADRVVDGLIGDAGSDFA
jgi:hypothetical protein